MRSGPNLDTVGGMHRDPGVPLTRRLSRRDWLVLDGVLAVVFLAATIARIPNPEHSSQLSGTAWDVVRYVAAVMASVPLAVRRRWPVPVLAVVTAGDAVLVALGSHGPALIGVAFAIYTVAVTSTRRVPLRTAGAVAGVMLLSALVAPGGPEWAGVIAGPAVVLVGWFAGESKRARRAYAQSQAERAAEREREREERVRQAATDERLRIARELHDIVAHAMSVIAVQAGAGRMVIDSQPEETRAALSIIETTSRRALREMRRLVGVLRQPEDATGAELEPAPSLRHLDELIRQTTRAGVQVDLDVTGDVRPLPPGVDVSAYRIIQEALTNVVRHAGPTAAHLHVSFGPRDVTIELLDEGFAADTDPRHQATNGSGHGLVGMRERVALYHGELLTEPSGHGYRVLARLPIDDDHQ
jgi:signal transduction histidine kinase